MNELIIPFIIITCEMFAIAWMYGYDPDEPVILRNKIFIFLCLEMIAIGLISGIYILLGGANGIHI